MLTMLGVCLRQQLSLLPALTGLSAQGDARYPDQAAEWLLATEQELSRLRRHEAGLFATLRGRLVATREGFRDPQVPGELTNRKALKAAAAVYLSQGEALLRDTLSALDAQLQPLRGQLAQLISAGYLLGLLSPPDGVVHESWLRLCWSRLAEHEQTRGMAVYLTTALSPVDRLYLFDELLGNLHFQPDGARAARSK